MEQQQDYSSIAELNSRLRILESKYTLMRERVFVVNQNMIEEYKTTMTEIKSINSDLKELKIEIFKIKETTANVVKEIGMLARKEQLKILEKYINFWNPLNFVTEKEVHEIVQEKVGKRKHD